MADSSKTPALGFMHFVSSRDAATLILPIIAVYVASGTEVHSDQWIAYNRVGSLSSIADRSTVNHSALIDTGTDTQHIEWAVQNDSKHTEDGSVSSRSLDIPNW